MFNLDPRTGMWTPKPAASGERLASPPPKMPAGLNRHGCWWMFSYHWQEGKVRQHYVATLEGFAELLRRECGPDGREDAECFRTMVEWAAECKPGAVECYHEVHWIIAIDPAEDHSCLLDGLDGEEWRRWEALRAAAGLPPS